MSQDNIKAEIKAILLTALREVDCYVFLFGSQASGGSSDRSDYDIGILAKEALDFELLARTKDYMGAIPMPIDVVDFYNTQQDFRNIALRHVEVWKEPQDKTVFKFQINTQ